VRILIDSADEAAIAEALASGFVWGVTTNPTLLCRAGVRADDLTALVKRSLALGANEVHCQVYSSEPEQMLAEAETFLAWDAKRVVVKIPATPAGYAAAARISAQQGRVTLTAIYTVRQIILAQSVGAEYAAVYLGRMRDAGLPAEGVVEQMQTAITAQQSPVKLLAASIRDAFEVEMLALIGVPSVTLPIGVLRTLLDSTATAEANSVFAKDAQAIQ
jgi:transaldolase